MADVAEHQILLAQDEDECKCWQRDCQSNGIATGVNPQLWWEQNGEETQLFSLTLLDPMYSCHEANCIEYERAHRERELYVSACEATR